MHPILTIGVTTHNERENIETLLNRLAMLDERNFHIVLFDDASSDGTASLISKHPLAQKSHFEAHLAKKNFGSPSVGRQFIAQQARATYVAFVDGDDLIDPKALMALATRLKPGFDIIITPFMHGRRREFPAFFDNEKPLSNDTISRFLSGIGGKVYNREALRLHTKDEIKGRSEDVRLNMRILLGGFDKVRVENVKPFYFIVSSRKSTLARNILLHEIDARVRNYQVLKERYGVDDTYIRGLHRNLLKVVREDVSLSELKKRERYQAINNTMPFRMKRIVHLVENPGHIGGIPGRIRSTILAAQDRPVRHVCLAAQGNGSAVLPDTLDAETNEPEVVAFLRACHATDTVVITPNNIFRAFSPTVQEQLNRLPIIHMASGQLAFILQDTRVLADLEYVENYRVSQVLCLSDMDMSFHRQLGIHALTKISLPVATRTHNNYSSGKNRFVTYVGRIDFHAKGADRLIPIAKLMKERGLPPLRIFTMDGLHSPDLPAFLSELEQTGLSDWVQIIYNSTDKQAFYDQASVLLLPSCKEAFGNVILEAFSYGVPVIAPSYAPGPAEIIHSGQDGFLLDEFSTEAVINLLEDLTPERLAEMSHMSFARHREYSMEQYLASLEEIADRTARSFSGKNEISPFPKIKATEALTTQPVTAFLMKRFHVKERLLAGRIYLVERVLPWPVVKALRWIKAKLR